MKSLFPRTEKHFAISALVIAFATLVYGLISLNGLRTQYSVTQFLPENHPAIQLDREVRAKFQLADHPTFIAVLSLRKNENGTWLESRRMKRLTQITEQLQSLPGVERALSVANVQGAANVRGTLSVGELIQLVPKKEWNERILTDNLLTPNLIDEHGRTVLIYVVSKNSNSKNLQNVKLKMRQLLEQKFPEAVSSVGGVPAVQSDLSQLLNKELGNFLALTLLACAVTLLLIFRSFSSIWIPLILVGYCNVMVFAAMAWMGITFTILSSTIPIMVFIDVMTIATHILLRLDEEKHRAPKDISRWELIKLTHRSIWLPNALGSISTSVGFLTLIFSPVPMISSYGVTVFVAILLSSLLTSIGITPLLLLFPLPEPRQWVRKPARWSLWIIHYRRPILVSTVIACLVLGFCGRNLQWTGRLFDDLPKGQEARRSTEKIDRTMGGVIPVQIVVKAPPGKDWNDPKRIQQLDDLLISLRKIKGVGTAQSLPDFLRASRIHANSSQPSRAPASRATIAETYFLYSLAPSNPLTQYLTPDNRSVRIELKIRDLPSNQVEPLLQRIKRTSQIEFPESHIQIAGMGASAHQIHNQISHDLIFGFWHALLAIIFMLIFVFRSLRWALVAAVPNLIPPIALLGYLALTATPIKPGVAIIFSIALGLAFTNTIYALNRMKELRRKGAAFPVSRTFHLEGNPCLVATLVVMMGFSVFLFSYFELNRTFGACMLIALIGGIIGDLAFLPALLRTAPWLLEHKSVSK